ncbi:MAG: hypothetical protein LUF92_14750 [Clostridiales bacterium]|nr:hypothetical protein [Clostridiales bacterium]
MSILMLLAAFGGGVFAASIGALPAFIMTGVFAIVGAVANMCGATDAGNILVNYIAFGSFFGPHISFAAGVAAAAYAKKKGISDNGADIATACAGYNAPDVLLIGGVFGVIGFLFKELVVANLFAGTISARLVTDAPGFTVFCSGLLVRIIFGGKLRTGDKVTSGGSAFTNTIVIGISYSLMIAGVYCAAVQAGVPVDAFGGSYHVLVFGLAAVGLFFAEMGQPFYGCHHIVIIAAEATVQSYNTTGSLWTALIMGVIFGTISAIICDVEGALINSGTDSHIDGPATAILIMTFAVNACFPA